MEQRMTSTHSKTRDGSLRTSSADESGRASPWASENSDRLPSAPAGSEGSPAPLRTSRKRDLFLEIPTRISSMSADTVMKASTFIRRASFGDATESWKSKTGSQSVQGGRATTKDSNVSRTSSVATSSTGLPEDQVMRAIQMRHGRRLSIGASEGVGADALRSVPWDDLNKLTSRREADLTWEDTRAPTYNANVVTFFDWDDTLLPTTAVASDRGWEGRPKDEEVEALTAHAKVVHECLLKARAAGRVAIVTLGKRPWVQVTCERYLMGVDWKSVFQDLGIVVIYAQEVLNKAKRQTAMREDGVNFWIASKTEAMAKAIRRFEIKHPGPLEVISIGDSFIEVEAAQEVVWRRTWKEGMSCCCKTLKLQDEPQTVEALTAQLQEMLPWWDKLHQHPADLRLSFEDLSKEDCPLRRAAPPQEQAESMRRTAICALCGLCSSWCSLGRVLKTSQKASV